MTPQSKAVALLKHVFGEPFLVAGYTVTPQSKAVALLKLPTYSIYRYTLSVTPQSKAVALLKRCCKDWK